LDWKNFSRIRYERKYGVNVVAIKSVDSLKISVLRFYEIQENNILVVIGKMKV